MNTDIIECTASGHSFIAKPCAQLGYAAPSIPECFSVVNLTQDPFLHQKLYLLVIFSKTLVHSHCEDLATLFYRSSHLFALLKAHRKRLFQQNVLSSLQGLNSQRSMEFIGDRDIDRVYVWISKQVRCLSIAIRDIKLISKFVSSL